MQHDFVRAWWLCRLNNALQALWGAIASRQPGAIQRALPVFERRVVAPATVVERMLLRGGILETYLRLDSALGDSTSADDRAQARRVLYAVPLAAPIEQLLAPCHHLTAAAQRMRTLPLHERVRVWIDEHPDDHRSVTEIAALLGAHPRTISRHFSRHVGKTVQEYRWDRRAEHAAQLMANAAIKVDEVASVVGAGSKATMYRLLHKQARSDLRRPAR